MTQQHRPIRQALRSLSSIACAVLVGAAGSACDDGSATPDPDSGVTDSGVDPTVDSGPPAPREISYTPEGCGYQVASPVVDEAGMHEETFGATGELDHVHVSWAGAPESTFAVNWRSDVGTRSSLVLYGTDRAEVEAADGAAADVMQQVGHHMRYASLGGRDATRVHEVHVCGLSPDTTYFYKVGGPGHWSEVFETATAPVAGTSAPFSFGVSGDARGNGENAWAIIQRRMHERAVDFEVFTGDAVILGAAQDQWSSQFFEPTDGAFRVQDSLATRALMMANGNHDALAVPYLAQFAWPQEVSTGEGVQGEEWYSFDYANAHFVFLNDTVVDEAVLGGAQRDWLESDLASVDRSVTPWIFVVHHRALYTCHSTHSPDRGLRADWQPVLDAHGVDLVLAGHNHVYERSAPVRGLDAANEGMLAPVGAAGVPTFDAAGTPSGTIYVVAGAAGAPLYPVDTDCPTSIEGQSVRNYVVVEVDGRSIRLTAYDALTDAVLDTLEYTK